MLRYVMGRVWPITLAAASLAFLFAAGGCGDGERLDPGAGNAGAGGHTLSGDGGGGHGNRAGDAGAGEPGGEGGLAGAGTKDGSGGVNGGSGGSRPRGGSGGTSSGGTGNRGGTGGTASGKAGAGEEAGDRGLAGEGSGATGGITQLDLCVRLSSQPSTIAWDVSRAFEISVNTDCRINWVRLLYLDPDIGLDKRVPFLNQLITFSTNLWGCLGSTPPQSFDLVWKLTPLSAADIELLIDDYIAAASGPLTLSPGETRDLRALLNRLAEPYRMEPDPGGLSNSRCELGAAGAAGAGGQAGSG